MTRRCTSVSSESASFEKSELMCFSTARSDSPSAAPIPALFRPCAISASTSLSRGVRKLEGRLAARPRGSTSASTTRGSITEPPVATASIARRSWSTSDTRSFSR